MCGIAGVVGIRDTVSGTRAVHAMCGELARRGPDGQGTAHWDAVVFGHRRLAIFDLSDAGRQPMLTADGRIGVVFNGAIYNYRQLRGALSDFPFRSQTDTEVLLHGYRKWGIDGLVRRLRGMFAFALWDESQRKLFLVRDRLGVKPLVFAIRDGVLAFASTVRALSVAGYATEIEPEAVSRFLHYGFVPEPLSIHRGVTKVPPASIVEVAVTAAASAMRTTTSTYWTQPSFILPTSFDDAVDATREHLLEAVKVRLHADVPVGTLLSGGIDSSLVCWAAQELGANIEAYTVATPGDPWDESAAATDTAQRLSLKHCVVEMSDSDLPQIDELISAYAEPFACASALGMLRVSRAISQFSSVKVLLTGDGGDDVFLGYPRHRHLWLASALSRRLPAVPAAWRRMHRWVPRTGPLRRGAALLDYTTWGLRGFLAQAEYLNGQDLRRGLRTAPATGQTALTDLLTHEFNTEFLSEYLVKVDGAAMRHGIEARSPFLDQQLWEFAASIPFDVRLRHGRLKAVLRELVRREIGPDVARRKKRGFGVPVRRWLAGKWRLWAEDLLASPMLEREGWITSTTASTLRASLKSAEPPSYAWYAVVLESWLRHARRSS